MRQDKALDNIEKGLVQLKGIGEAMGENLSQQDVLLAEIDQKVIARCRLPYGIVSSGFGHAKFSGHAGH